MVFFAAAEEHAEVRKRRDRAATDSVIVDVSDVSMLDVREFVRHHAAKLARGEDLQQARVAATAACSGLRPLRNAFGCASSIR